MSCLSTKRSPRVILLTLALALTLSLCASGCAYIERRYAEPCKSHAYIAIDVRQYLNSRFNSNSQVRLGVVPYAVPANLSFRSTQDPGLGFDLAREIQSELLPTGTVPIVEVFNRTDWPAKNEEFFTGSFGAIALARDAGYDLVMTGYVEPLRSLDTMAAYTKIIEVESGITVYYGKSIVTTRRPEWDDMRASLWFGKEVPNQHYIPDLVTGLSRCIVHGVKSTD